ncbi:hypothetical protein [Flavivirga eckloniae]|uniref:Uncharacterized protein n=1 Tax=Flavivirga eckloniae TaxID=1803846 RepID=A0A2K9PK55_9FLAO|nr:hypothetical protein [Flavivirga eckloniae]AUP77451.1 hypothetical protein C1H87_01430 [Flavivirga eckloniae]
MKYFFKTLLIVALFLGTLQACQSDETTEEIKEDNKISTDLRFLMEFTTLTKNDYNRINFNCEDVHIVGYFLNNQGDFYPAPKILTFLPKVLANRAISSALKAAYNETEIQFTKDDFRIFYISNNDIGIVLNKKSIAEYLEDCSFKFDEIEREAEMLTVSDVNFNCSGLIRYFVPDGLEHIYISKNGIPISEGIWAVKNALSAYNEINNTEFTMDQLRINQVRFTSPGGTSSFAYGANEIKNYFENCALKGGYGDCINFKYPFTANRVNIQTDEIVLVTVANDADLDELTNNVDNTTLNFPITLVTLNDEEIVVESYEKLEEVLRNTASYCKNINDDW